MSSSALRALTLPALLLVLAACSDRPDSERAEPAAQTAPTATTAEQADATPMDDAAPTAGDTATTGAAEAPWSCPMHPDVTSMVPGRCPKCGMFLTRPPAETEAEHSHDDHGHDHGHDHDHSH